MVDIASLGYAVDTSGLARGTQALDEFHRHNQQAAVGMGAMEAAAKRAGITVEQYQQRMATASQATRQFSASATDLIAGMSRVGKATNEAFDANRRLVTGMSQTARSTTEATASQDRYRDAMRTATQIAEQYSGRLGAVGVVAARLGPAMLGIGTATAVAVLAFKEAAQASFEFAENAGKLVDFAATTGLTTDALQALNKAGSQVGITSQQLGTGLERFTSQFAEMRLGSGELFDQISRVDAGLARQMATAKDAAAALDLYIRAIAKANDFDAARLARAGMGRGGVGFVRLARAADEAGGLQELIRGFDEADRRSKDLLTRVDDLGDRIAFNSAKAKENVVSIFAEPTLRGVDNFTTKLLESSRTLVTIKSTISDDAWQRWVNGILSVASALPIVGQVVTAARGLANLFSTPTPAAPSGRRGVADAMDREAAADEVRRRTEAREADTASIIRNYNEMNRWMQVIGSAATPAQQLQLRLSALSAALAEGKINADQYRQGVAAVNEEHRVNQIQTTVAALGSAATATERYTAELARLQQQLRTGQIDQATFARGVASLQRDMEMGAMRSTVSALGEAATASEEYRLRVMELSRDLANGTISQETFNRAVMAADPIFRMLTKGVDNFFTTLLSGLARGEGATKSLQQAFSGLGQTLISSGMREAFGPAALASLASGNFAAFGAQAGPGLAIAGIGAAISGIIAGQERRQQRREELQRQAAEAQQTRQQQLDELRQRNALAGLDTSTQEGALAEFDIRAAAERARVSPGGKAGANATLLEETLAKERLAIIKRFADQAIEEEKRKAEEIERIQEDLRDREFAAANDNSTFIGAIAEFERRTARERIEIAKTSAELIPQFDRTAAAERAAIERRFAEEAAARRQSVEDEIFALQNNTNTLEGQLAAVEREHQRRREDELKRGGEALADIDALFAARRLRTVEDFNERLIAETERAEAERFDAINRAARSIVEYLNQLNTGPDSALTPQARLAAAQAAFNSQLSLAQGGDVSAAASITQFAETLRRAAQDVFASGTGFQQILQTIQSSLIGLPQVTQSTDPVVQSLAEVVSAVNAVNSTTGTVATNTGSTATAAQSTASSSQSTATSSQSTAGSTASTAAEVAVAVTRLGTVIDRLAEVIANLGTVITRTTEVWGAVGTSDSQGLRGLISTMDAVQDLMHLNTRTIAAQSGILDNILDATGEGWRANNAGLLAQWEQGVNPPPTPKPVFEIGGTLGAGRWGIMGEHHPQGPFMVRAGSEPLPISPRMPSLNYANDNGADAILAQLRSMQRQNAMLLARLERVERESAGAVAAAVSMQTRRLDRTQRESDQRARAGRRAA